MDKLIKKLSTSKVSDDFYDQLIQFHFHDGKSTELIIEVDNYLKSRAYENYKIYSDVIRELQQEVNGNTIAKSTIFNHPVAIQEDLFPLDKYLHKVEYAIIDFLKTPMGKRVYQKYPDCSLYSFNLDYDKFIYRDYYGDVKIGNVFIAVKERTKDIHECKTRGKDGLLFGWVDMDKYTLIYLFNLPSAEKSAELKRNSLIEQGYSHNVCEFLALS